MILYSIETPVTIRLPVDILQVTEHVFSLALHFVVNEIGDPSGEARDCNGHKVSIG
jgi:hypothetical protein